MPFVKGKTGNGTTDKVYTPEPIAKLIINKFSLSGKVLDAFKGKGVCVHPTEKPVALLEYLVKTYTNEGDTVLDNCMGSGSTGVACKNTNREFIGMELDEKYYKIACERLGAQ